MPVAIMLSPCPVFPASNRADGVQRAGRGGAVQGFEHELGQGTCGHQHQLHDLRFFEAEVRHLLTDLLLARRCWSVVMFNLALYIF